MNKIINTIEKESLIAIMRGVPDDKCLKVAKAIIDGGVKILEVAFNPSDPDTIQKTSKIIRDIKNEFGDNILIGAGTVIYEDYLVAAYESGAEFIYSPDTDADIIRLTKKLGLVSIPGAITPTECKQALKAGADIIKLFPTTENDLGYIVNISRPLSHMKFICTGGVNLDTIEKFLSIGAIGLGTGISIIRPDLVESDNYQEIANLAKKHVDIIKEFKENR